MFLASSIQCDAQNQARCTFAITFTLSLCLIISVTFTVHNTALPEGNTFREFLPALALYIVCIYYIFFLIKWNSCCILLFVCMSCVFSCGCLYHKSSYLIQVRSVTTFYENSIFWQQTGAMSYFYTNIFTISVL